MPLCVWREIMLMENNDREIDYPFKNFSWYWARNSDITLQLSQLCPNLGDCWKLSIWTCLCGGTLMFLFYAYLIEFMLVI